jgi:hypothetical protein
MDTSHYHNRGGGAKVTLWGGSEDEDHSENDECSSCCTEVDEHCDQRFSRGLPLVFCLLMCGWILRDVLCGLVRHGLGLARSGCAGLRQTLRLDSLPRSSRGGIRLSATPFFRCSRLFILL